MGDQYELETVSDFAFERNPVLVRGSLYRCTVCGQRPIKIKGVLSELTGKERTSFKQKYNAMHRRHKPTCVPPRDSIEPTERTATTNDEPAVDGSDGGAGGATVAYESEEDEAPPSPLDSKAIRAWTVQSVTAAVLYWGNIPAKVEEMKYIPHSDGGCPFVQCLIRNEHGAVSLKLASSLVFNVPSLRAQYEACVARWKRAEHQQLVELFERACDHTSSEAVRSALERLLPRR